MIACVPTLTTFTAGLTHCPPEPSGMGTSEALEPYMLTPVIVILRLDSVPMLPPARSYTLMVQAPAELSPSNAERRDAARYVPGATVPPPAAVIAPANDVGAASSNE